MVHTKLLAQSVPLLVAFLCDLQGQLLGFLSVTVQESLVKGTVT